VTASPQDVADQFLTVSPGIHLDRDRGVLELDAKIIGREVDWLELLACSPNSREHESIVTVEASATQIHAALLLLGLEPGSPMTHERKGDEIVVTPPSGPAVEIFFVVDDQLVPANEWVVSQETGEVMQGNRWLFTGSRMVEYEGESYYLAQQNGTLISVVNFGDDLLGRPDTQPADGGNDLWTTNTQAIPPGGTELRLRLVVVEPDKENEEVASE
jgi:hypothetical protein